MRRKWVVTLISMLGVVALSACTNQTRVDSPAVASAAGAAADGPLSIAVISHSKPGDPFWDVVKTGAEQAGDEVGATVDYSGNDDSVQQSQLIDNAVARGVSGIVVSMANPDGVEASVRNAVRAGVAVVTMNSGIEKFREFGAITHVGQSEGLAGEAAGLKLSEPLTAPGKLLCIIHESGNLSQEERCQGAARTFRGETENLQVDISNLADAQSTIRSKLGSDRAITSVLALNSAIATVGVSARGEAARSEVILGTFDVDDNNLEAIRRGDVFFAVDQQPYLQGYLPVVTIALKIRNGNLVGGGQPVYSGPSLITIDNVDEVSEFARVGTR